MNKTLFPEQRKAILASEGMCREVAALEPDNMLTEIRTAVTCRFAEPICDVTADVEIYRNGSP